MWYRDVRKYFQEILLSFLKEMKKWKHISLKFSSEVQEVHKNTN